MNWIQQKKNYDLVVAGGGIAGICCAVASARGGLRVALVQDRSVLGGNSSSEIRVPPAGAVACNPWMMETGLIEELLLRERAEDANPDFFAGNVSSTYDRSLLEFVEEQPNLDLYRNTTVFNVELSGGETPDGRKKIACLHALSSVSGTIWHFSASQFADCTGDGTVAFLSGAHFVSGREGRGKFGEHLAPLQEDDHRMGSSIYFTARRTPMAQEFIPPKWAKKFSTRAEIGFHSSNLGCFDGEMTTGYWWMEISNPFDTIYQDDQIYRELLAYIYGIWDYIKNNPEGGYTEKAKNFALDWVGSLPGKRESRRFPGDVILTEHNCREIGDWPDAIATAGWFLDLHVPGGVKNTDDPPDIDANYSHFTRVSPYNVPLRALYSREIANLWLGGRCMSASHVAFSSLRVQCTLGALGQAIGTAVAYSVPKKLLPRELWHSPHREAIRQNLLREDVRILECRNEDPEDLARGCEVTASHDLPLNLEQVDCGRFEELSTARAQVFPVTHTHIERIWAYLKNTGSKSAVVYARLTRIKNIWDQGDGQPLGKTKAALPADFEGWTAFDFDCTVTPQSCCRFELDALPRIYWARSRFQPAGTSAQNFFRCTGGAEPTNSSLSSLSYQEADIPPYEGWYGDGTNSTFSHAVKILPCPQPFGGENVINGCAWPECTPNLWKTIVTDPGSSWLEIDFHREVRLNTVILTFDTDLNFQHIYLPPRWRQNCCPEAYRLLIRSNGGWVEIYSRSGNYQRRNTARFDTVTTDAMRLEILRGNLSFTETEREKCNLPSQAEMVRLTGDRTIGVYEIRAYLRE